MLRKGFIDLQVNGYLGVDFASPSLEAEDIHRVTHALLEAGTVGYCATLVSSDLEVYRRNLPLLAQAMEEPGIKGHLLGIHLEGPYLSDEPGARGAHRSERLRRPDREEFDRLQDCARGRIALITLAPELDNALDLISSIHHRYATRIALGHHLASREIILRATEAGASISTHLGNGCPNLLPRNDNIIIYQLANDRLTAGLITDGNHLPEDFIRMVFNCKGIDKVFVVSDSAPIAGFEPGIYQTLGQPVRLSPNGRVDSLDEPHQVGSGRNMAQCMRHLRSLGFLSDDELWRAGYENPLRLLGMSPEALPPESLPDFEF